MCGIVGIITNSNNGFTHDEVETLKDLAFMDTVRGADATGIMYGVDSGAIQVHKAAVPAWAFNSTREFEQSKDELYRSGRWAVVHNRAATRGAKIDANSHPFIVDDNIVLVQNGTYKGSHHHHKNTDVDTEACAHVIAEAASVEEAMQQINAAYVFVWYNVKEKSLNFVRNDERPLYTSRVKGGSVLFSSEPGIMLAAALRNSLELVDKPYLLKDACHHKYTFNDNDWEYSSEDINIAYRGDNNPFLARGTSTGSRQLEQPAVVATGTKPTHIGRALSVTDAMLFLNDRQVLPITHTEADVVSKLVYEKKNSSSYVFEGIDFVKVVELDVSDNWYYVFATIISEDDLNGCLVCWMVEGEEKQVLNYTINHMFKGKLSYTTRRPYQGRALQVIIVEDDVSIVADLTEQHVH